jgi:hypothetical protein
MTKSLSRIFLAATLFVSGIAMAQPSTTNMLGPLWPARADTDGSGSVTPADAPVTPTRASTNTITITSPWQTGVNGNNTLLLSNLSGSGDFQTFTRVANDGLTDVLTVTGFTGGTPSSFSMIHTGGGTTNGTGQLLDQDSNGIFDGISGDGPVDFSINFVHIDSTGDGWADYISIPWSQAQLVGVAFDNPVGGRNPQVWVPLADTNGDTRGDAIVPDFDGNGAPDPDLYASDPGAFGPVLAPAVLASATVPTLSQWAMLLTLLLLSVAAVMQLRRMQNDNLRF